MFVDPSGLAYLRGNQVQNASGQNVWVYTYRASNQTLDTGTSVISAVPIMGMFAQAGMWAGQSLSNWKNNIKIIELPNARSLQYWMEAGSTAGNILQGLSLAGEAAGYFPNIAKALGKISYAGTGLGGIDATISFFNNNTYKVERAVQMAGGIIGTNTNMLKQTAAWAEFHMADMMRNGHVSLVSRQVGRARVEELVWHDADIKAGYFAMIEAMRGPRF